MSFIDYLELHPLFFYPTSIILGLLVGSFLNVVIYRLPIMLEREWRKESRQMLDLPEEQADSVPFNLAVPGSRCPHCQQQIRPWQNIPVISYLLLQGRCAHCHQTIALRYPLIEATCGILTGIVAWHFGISWQALYGVLLTWSLLALCMIDIDQQLLPDNITLPLLWSGLLLSLAGVFATPEASIIGSAAGYLSLWSVYKLFKLLTGKEGMGYGDFKLLAALGAWFGWQMLPAILLLAAASGAVIGILMILLKGRDRQATIPFGPYLAIAGWLALMFQPQITAFYFG